MPGPGRLPPPITVVVPGRGPVPAELLAVGPPAVPHRTLPAPHRALLVAVLLVLSAGVLTAVDQRSRDAVPAVPVARAEFPDVSATARVLAEEPLLLRLALRVHLRAEAAAGGAVGEAELNGQELSGTDASGAPRAVEVRLRGVQARGFSVDLGARRPTLLLGYVGRFGSGLDQQVRIRAEVVVTDCSVEVGAPRTLTLDLRRGDRRAGPTGSVVVRSDPSTVRALDDLVRRSCRRPRG